VFQVLLSDAAKSDIRSNVTWCSENRSKEEAERWYNTVMKKSYSLKQLPFRCPIARESVDYLESQINSELQRIAIPIVAEQAHALQ
jgi:plasmid stabilization system protein ParE